MHTINIIKPAKVGETQAQQLMFKAFKMAMSDVETFKASIVKGNSMEIAVDGYLAYIGEAYNAPGEYSVKLYTPEAHTPCASCYCDQFDA